MMVTYIPPGRYPDIAAVLRAAETHARSCIAGAVIHRGAGSGKLWPFFEEVLNDDTLGLISPELLSMRKADELRSDLGEHDNRLFLPSPKETKVAKALGHPKPTTAEGGADLKPLFEEAATGDDTAGEGGEGGAELVTPPTARKTATKPRPRTVRSETSSLPNLNKQVVDSTIASHLIETLRGIHERLTSTLFRRSSQLMTGAGGPQLSLPDLNPVVGAQILGVVKGQLALLYTARATATRP